MAKLFMTRSSCSSVASGRVSGTAGRTPRRSGSAPARPPKRTSAALIRRVVATLLPLPEGCVVSPPVRTSVDSIPGGYRGAGSIRSKTAFRGRHLLVGRAGAKQPVARARECLDSRSPSWRRTRSGPAGADHGQDFGGVVGQVTTRRRRRTPPRQPGPGRGSVTLLPWDVISDDHPPPLALSRTLGELPEAASSSEPPDRSRSP